MKRILAIIAVMALCSTVNAYDFSPSTLTLSAPEIVYFDETGADIAVTVGGTRAQVMFLIFTENSAENITNVQNGHLGWHYVNKVDTCVYVSSPYQFSRGENTISWDGKDQGGNTAAVGNYTYYLFGFDNKTSKKAASRYMPFLWDDSGYILTHDGSGNPLERPVIYGGLNEWLNQSDPWERIRTKWVLGNDPENADLIETTLYSGWNEHSQLIPDPEKNSHFYITTVDNDCVGHLRKYAWVSNGESELQTDWGNDGEYLWSVNSVSGVWCAQQPLNIINNDVLVTTNTDTKGISDSSELILVDRELGYEIDSIDLSEWWIRIDDGQSGGLLSSGPNDIDVMHGKIILGSHSSCLNQVMDPLAADDDEMNLWINANGDYLGDKNFDENAGRPWVCNDDESYPNKYSVSFDDNLFVMFSADGFGSNSFGVYAPDGTGIGYFSFSNETAGYKYGQHFVDTGSAFDGIYCDNTSGGYEGAGWFYVGHDSFKGSIRAVTDAVETDLPEEFMLSQNTPNPFNPSTTINFSLPSAGIAAMDIYNTAGQKVDTIANEYLSAGSHTVTWDASGFSAGVYFCTLKSGNLSKTMKMTVLK